jgi:PEP-CTERM motif
MLRIHARLAIPLSLLGCLSAMPAAAETPFSFSTGNPDGLMATATRPDSPGKFEIESADDFVITHSTSITSATFTGLLPIDAPLSDIGEVVVEIYRVFPKDSQDPPSMKVPTRVNSPSDVAFDSRDSTSGLTFTPSVVSATFPGANSVQPGGIVIPPPHTGGDGPVTGEEVKFSVDFTNPFLLPADHYFFVPQVQLADGTFLWLSAPKPIVAPGTPFPPGFTDLQSWTRDDPGIAPDWLRVGTDIVGPNSDDVTPTFNAAFSLNGALIPEPSTWAMMLLGFAGLGFAGYRRAFHVRTKATLSRTSLAKL